MTDSNTPSITSPIYNVQPTPQNSKSRSFPSLPYTAKNLKVNNEFNFQFSDLTETEYNTLCNLVLILTRLLTLRDNFINTLRQSHW